MCSFRTFDGRDVPAFLYAPEGAKADGSNAVIMSVHGGPEGQERPAFNAQYQYFVSRGYCVLAPNVRGSSGYGRTYIHLDDVRKRMDSVRDLGVGVELAAGLGLGGPEASGSDGRQLWRFHGAGGDYELSRPVGGGGGAVRHRQLRDVPGEHQLVPPQAAGSRSTATWRTTGTFCGRFRQSTTWTGSRRRCWCCTERLTRACR